MTLKVAFAGTGYIAKIHAQAVKNLAESHQLKLEAVVNHSVDSMAAFAHQFNIQRQYTDMSQMLADGGIDALIVSTPNYLHYPQTVSALEQGIHVLVEKPMAMNAEEAAQMQAVATQAQLMVAHCWRFDEEVLWLKAQVEAGKFGQIVRTKGYGVHVNWGPSGWFTVKQYAGGGALADMGIHAIDTVRFLLGDPQPMRVWARISTRYGSYDVDDTGILIIEWDNGVTSYIESGWWQPHADGPEAGTYLYGTRGYGSLFPTGGHISDPLRQSTLTLDSGFAPKRDPHYPQSMYDAQMKHFIECIRDGRTPKPGAAEGVINMRIVDAAYRSSETGEFVTLQT
jgi:predicted dehydrogenase